MAFHYDMHCDAKEGELNLRFGDRIINLGKYVPVQEYESDVLPREAYGRCEMKRPLRRFPVNLLQCRDDKFSSFFS